MRIGLTRDQVNDEALDIARLGIGVKSGDSRTRAFVREFGRTCWEADILPAATIEAALDEHVNGWLDADRWNRRGEGIDAARRLL